MTIRTQDGQGWRAGGALGTVVAMTLVWAAPVAAMGQNALGDGRALDKSLHATDGAKGNPQRSNLVEQIRFNNQIITGQAGGGRSFRGSVGYRATDEFGGSRASDNTYTFRRDSAAGGVVSSGLRASDALRLQFGLTGGGAVPAGGATLFSTPRTEIANGSSVSSLRSLSEYRSASGQLPVVLGYGGTAEDQRVVTASPLRGVTALPAPKYGAETGSTLTGFERSIRGVAGVRDALAEEEAKQRAEQARANAAGRVDQRAEEPPAYRRVLEEIAKQAQPADLRLDPRPGERPVSPGPKDKDTKDQPGTGAEPETTPKAPWLIDLERLRARMKEQEHRKSAEPAPARPPDASLKSETQAEAAKAREDREKALELKPDDSLLQTLKKLNARIETFVAPVPIADLYSRNISQAEEAMGSRRYFDAEALYAMALAVKPRDVLAQVGRAHAQLGAGLYLSAGANLRGVLQSNPEMTGVRYGAGLLPSSERSQDLAEELGKHLVDPGSALGSDAALLLAYLGYHQQRPEWIEQGLSEMSRRLPENEPDGPEATFLRLVRSVWGAEKP